MKPADTIEESIKKLRYKTDAETHEKILGNVLQSLDKNEEQKSGVISPAIWPTIINTKTRNLAAAAVILIAATITLHYIVGPISRSSTAYAEVAERLQKALTITYKMTKTPAEWWMPNMECEVAFKEPGLLRVTTKGGLVSVMDAVQGKCRTIIPRTKQVIEISMYDLPDDPGQNQLSVIERLRSLPDRADEELGERELDGRTVQGFRVTEEGVTCTVWIDPKTRKLVEIGSELVKLPGRGHTITDIRFNVDLPDELFTITPPAGYTRLELDVDGSEPSEDDLIEFLRWWSSLAQDSTFPPSVNPAELPTKAMTEIIKAGKFGPDGPVEDEGRDLARGIKVTRAFVFVVKLPAESNSHYSGENVKHGDAETPIFRYQPAGSQTYRVIYGDLSVKDVSPDDLPQ